MLRYIQLRLIRLKSDTKSIAVGFAFGASISFTPLPGFHLILGGLMSFATKGNLIAMFIGTLIGNPWTIPFMWWCSYKLGYFLFELFGAQIVELPDGFSWEYFMHQLTHNPMNLIIPWVTGGVMMMAITWPIFYFLVYRVVHKLRKKRTFRF